MAVAAPGLPSAAVSADATEEPCSAAAATSEGSLAACSCALEQPAEVADEGKAFAVSCDALEEGWPSHAKATEYSPGPESECQPLGHLKGEVSLKPQALAEAADLIQDPRGVEKGTLDEVSNAELHVGNGEGPLVLPPIAEDGPAEAPGMSLDGVGFKSMPQETAQQRTRRRLLPGAVTRDSSPPEAEKAEKTFEAAHSIGVCEWGLYLMRQVSRLARRLDALEREAIPALQRSTLEAMSVSRNQESRLRDWTQHATTAINFLGEESVARRADVQELRDTLSCAMRTNSDSLGAAAAPSRYCAPTEDAAALSMRMSGGSTEATLAPAEVECFAAACRAAAESTTAAAVRFEQQVAEQSALLSKEFVLQRLEVQQMMETLSAQAAVSLKETWEELLLEREGICDEGPIRKLKASPEVCVSQKGTDWGDNDDLLPPANEEGESGLSHELSRDLATLEKSSSFRKFMMEDVCQVRQQLEAEDLPAIKDWGLCKVVLSGCNASKASSPTAGLQEKPALMPKRLWHGLLNRGGFTEEAASRENSSDLRAEQEVLIKHTAL
eukprot:CAMPEP_0179025636 /NCGR_PEP_ID=MMETSP0796-20121207/8092_1 /TAXON_ID=73915 /ORGANISM="Pyrodinium bahamense, Strain pbaha01" /LENGTH=554 /DNA_ID=CAMNT_0020721673 /DNA_START=1 /DNA_END=1664 /DNA_ORIENTATION=+